MSQKNIYLQRLNTLCFLYCFRRPQSARALVWWEQTTRMREWMPSHCTRSSGIPTLPVTTTIAWSSLKKPLENCVAMNPWTLGQSETSRNTYAKENIHYMKNMYLLLKKKSASCFTTLKLHIFLGHLSKLGWPIAICRRASSVGR